MRLLSVDEIIILHHKLIGQTGGSHGVRDMGLIESALNRGSATFGGVDLLKTPEAMIAAITFGLVNNHGFIDGNKRVGIAAMLLLARLNGIRLSYTQNELIVLGLGVAEGSIDEARIIDWIKEHQVG